MMFESVPGQKGLSDAELRIVAEVALEMARAAPEPFNAQAAALTFARAALKDGNAKRALAAMHRNISTRRAIEPHFSLGVVSTAADEPDATDVEGPSTVSNASPANEPKLAEELTPERADARANDNQAAQQALAASLAEIIDDVLRTRQFAVRAVFQLHRQSCM
jgi:hypothetical protein